MRVGGNMKYDEDKTYCSTVLCSNHQCMHHPVHIPEEVESLHQYWGEYYKDCEEYQSTFSGDNHAS